MTTRRRAREHVTVAGVGAWAVAGSGLLFKGTRINISFEKKRLHTVQSAPLVFLVSVSEL
jgi:hypothetical protein